MEMNRLEGLGIAKKKTMEEKLNTLRAGVLGSNDGVLTVVGVLFSVGAATTNHFTIFIAGLCDLIACAFSMAAGEYASVSAQKDTEKAVVAKEEQLNKYNSSEQIERVAQFYQNKGVSQATARAIAIDLMDKYPLQTVLSVKHDIRLGHYANPWLAAVASLFSAGLGGCLPLIAMTMLPAPLQWEGTIVAVIFASIIIGYLSARIGRGFAKKAIVRNLIIGIITMCIHYYVGILL